MIRRTAPIEVVAPELPGIVIRARPLTIPEACRLDIFRGATPLLPNGVAEMAVFLDSIGFVLEDEGKPLTAEAFLTQADIWTVQAVFHALLISNAYGPGTVAPPPPARTRPLVSPE